MLKGGRASALEVKKAENPGLLSSWPRQKPIVPAWLYAIAAVAFAVLIGTGFWAYAARINRVVQATGMLVSRVAPVIIRPLETGTVTDIDVKPGQIVHKGETLARMDSTLQRAELDKFKAELRQDEDEIARLRAEMATNGPIEPPKGESETETAIYSQTNAANRAQLSEYTHRSDDIRQQIESNIAQSRSAADELDLEKKQLEGIQKLYNEGYESTIEFLKIRQTNDSYESNLATLEGSRRSLTEQLRAIDSEKAMFSAKTVVDDGTQLNKDLNDRILVVAQIREAEHLLSLEIIRAPIDGIVEEISPDSGTLLSAAQPFLVILPLRAPIEAAVDIDNADAGLVKPGLGATVKIDAFPYTTFGTYNGIVRLVQPPSVSDAKDKSSPKSFKVMIFFRASNRGRRLLDQLRPGMTVHAELQIGTRLLRSYFFDPFKAHFARAFSEPR